MKRTLVGRFVVMVFTSASVLGQQQTRNTEWRTYGADLASTRYAPLDQVDGSNFNKLEIAWRFKTDNLGPRPEYRLQSTPLVVKGVLYSTGGARKAVVALDAETGELKWVHSINEGKRAELSPRKLSGRGLAYWSDGNEERIVYVTAGYVMVALDAKTGRPVRGFGKDGMVDLRQEADQQMDPITADIGLHAAPIIARDVIVIGAAHAGNDPGSGLIPKNRSNTKGMIRGYDVRSGKRLWIFHTIPRPGEFGNETWLNDSWSYTGNTGAWSQMSADEELGLVYVPTESATNDFYGGHRPGANLFANSILALDLKTGIRRWHFQTTHHELWDWDLPCAPILVDLVVDGRPIRALAQLSKQAFTYVLDRTNGQPLWPIEERPVPRGDVPGEWYSPTQPFPTRPPPFDRQGIGVDDLIDFTPELRAQAIKLVSNYKIGPIFTPPVVGNWAGPRAMLMLAVAGGANWRGGSLDPESKILYVSSSTGVFPVGLISDPKQSEMNYYGSVVARNPNPSPGAKGESDLQVQGLPLIKPPWGRITAIDLKKGELAWQVPHGETPDSVRKHPALTGLTIPRTGQGQSGTLVTKTLVIAGESSATTTPSGQRGAMLRAYDKATGREVGAVYMPAPESGSAMTYMLNGRQYIVIAIGGSNYSGELLAFRLPA
jgi:quinoprotein glucose dehydrogenase